MYRYFALAWNPADAAAVSHGQLIIGRLGTGPGEWEKVLDVPGLAAFHWSASDAASSCETRLLAGERGVVFGRLFGRGVTAGVRRHTEPLPMPDSDAASQTRGRSLIEHCWGRYVAVIRGATDGDVSVLRDPTGGMPCFVTTHCGVTLVCSDVESCLSLGLFKFSINWKYVASFVPYSALQIRDTGLNEFTEVQPGERYTVGGGRELLWKPSEIAAQAPVESFPDAVNLVRETVKAVVTTWASLHSSIIHNLSGGLDSSVVLSCLKEVPSAPDVTCLHFYFPASGEDERQYAQLAAKHMNAELVERALDPNAASLDRLLEIRPSPKPWTYVYDLLHSPIELGLMREKGAGAIFSGAGGDGLFLQARSDLAVADYMRRHGYRPGAIRVALNAARISRTSLWPILSAGVARHRRKRRVNALNEYAQAPSLIPREVFEAARNDDGLIHPWISSAGSIPPGLVWQILCLSVPFPFYESFGGETEIERTAVLMSQPLMELCLRIPTYVWIAGGRDRSIVRAAFAHALPRTIVRRTQKGSIDHYNRQVLDQNDSFTRELLLDGMLVKRGLLDRRQLERYMGQTGTPAGFEYNEVLRQHLCTEVWLRRWTQLESRAG